MLGSFFSKEPKVFDRNGERYDVSLRVMSPDLPGYRGVTVDISQSGVQLETSGLLEVGAAPKLKFEFDRGELESFTCPARVVWSKQADPTGRRFHSGLSFEAQTDDQRRLLSCMATVLQTRDDADLQTLLDQALRVDPDLEKNYRNISSTPRYRPAPEGALNQTATPTPGAPETGKVSSPGWYMPLSVLLEGYTWNRQSRTLHLGVKEDNEVHNLYFPECQMFQVLEPSADREIIGMYSTDNSPATRKLALSDEPGEYRHYRFVGEGGIGLIDVIASSCRSKP